MNSGSRRLFVAFIAVLAMARPGPLRLGEDRRHHRPLEPSLHAEQRLAGRHLHRRPTRADLLGRDARPVLRKRRRPSPGRLHPVHRRQQSRAAGPKNRSAN